MKRFFSLVFATFAFIAGTAVAAGPGKQDAVSMVEKAASFMKANGKDKLLAEVNVKDGQFHKGELYVFVYDMTATILAHPINAKLVGKNTYEMADPDGKFYRKDIVELAKSKGTGWVDYKYKNPETNKVEAKTSYIMKSGDVILVAGIYRD
jgi:signal transduction histidine kinase